MTKLNLDWCVAFLTEKTSDLASSLEKVLKNPSVLDSSCFTSHTINNPTTKQTPKTPANPLHCHITGLDWPVYQCSDKSEALYGSLVVNQIKRNI